MIIIKNGIGDVTILSSHHCHFFNPLPLPLRLGYFVMTPKSISINISSAVHEKRLHRKYFEVFSPRYFKNSIFNDKFNPYINILRAFFTKSATFFQVLSCTPALFKAFITSQTVFEENQIWIGYRLQILLLIVSELKRINGWNCGNNLLLSHRNMRLILTW